MSIPGSRSGLSVAQQLADDREAKRSASTKRREAVPKVVDAQAFEPGSPGYGAPGLFEVSPGCAINLAGNEVRIIRQARQTLKNYLSGCRQIYWLRSGFAVRQMNYPAFKVYIFPLYRQDFAETRSRQHQKPNGGNGVRVQSRA